jgi:hypothetical protein
VLTLSQFLWLGKKRLGPKNRDQSIVALREQIQFVVEKKLVTFILEKFLLPRRKTHHSSNIKQHCKRQVEEEIQQKAMLFSLAKLFVLILSKSVIFISFSL